MTTERLEEFAVLANLLNYSKAAETLFISQSVLSRHIQAMEKELGTTLFVRDTHGVHLTNEGKYFFKWAEPILKKTEQTITALNSEAARYEGSVRILCEEQTLNTHILTFLRAFRSDYPGVDQRLTPLLGPAKKEAVYGTDIFISSSDFTDTLRKGAAGAYLTSQEPLLAIPPYHHLGDMQEIRLDDLNGETLIVPQVDELYDPYARNAMVAGRKCRGALRKITAENIYAALLMVELGMGVMLIPHHLKHRIYPHTRTVSVSDPDCVFPIYVYRSSAENNPAAELFFDRITEEFKQSEATKK